MTKPPVHGLAPYRTTEDRQAVANAADYAIDAEPGAVGHAAIGATRTAEAPEDPIKALEKLGWTCEPTHVYDEEAVEGWLWTDGIREIYELGTHDEPPEIPDELLKLVEG